MLTRMCRPLMIVALMLAASCMPGSDSGTGSAGNGGSAGPGSAGSSGAAGSTGNAGTVGSAGATGEAGTTGIAGTTGTAGAGATGVGGTTGVAGIGGGGTTGAGGATGVAGRGGTTGAGGAAGRGGTTGAAGRGGTTGGSGTTGGGGRGGGSGSSGSGGSGGATARFSFFVTSLAVLRTLSGSQDGFGGDLRFGETGEGAGLRGADKICTTIAEMSMAGSGAKGWRAFLSAPAVGASPQVNAIDRIGAGPWYDRMGRQFSASKANLIGFRPSDADPAIRNDFPNEYGVPNHNPDGMQVDNHDMLTGSNANGMLYASTMSPNPTCDGWTNKTGSAGRPRVGHAWPRTPSNTNTCGGGGGGGTQGCYGHWMSSLDEAGCAPGINLADTGGPVLSNPTVGSGGGYGGFYCFALAP